MNMFINNTLMAVFSNDYTLYENRNDKLVQWSRNNAMENDFFFKEKKNIHNLKRQSKTHKDVDNNCDVDVDESKQINSNVDNTRKLRQCKMKTSNQ